MQIATSDAQVSLTMPPLYGQFIMEKQGLLLKDASGAHLRTSEIPSNLGL